MAKLDEAAGHADSDASNVDELVKSSAAINLNDGNDSTEQVVAAASSTEKDAMPCTPTLQQFSLTKLPALPISHWRTLPSIVTEAYKLLTDGAEYIHATSTKYTLVGKVDTKEGGNLAIELRKGAELIGTGTLLLYSQSHGSSRSLRHYIKQFSRGIILSVISLVQSFEDGLAQGKPNDGNNVGAQKTGAVWAACDKLINTLPRGNRAAMQRELMVWVRDCNESIEEFDEMLALGPRDDDEAEEEENMMDEEQYTESEIKVANSSINVIKCSKNVLGLVLKTCECVGEHMDKIIIASEKGKDNTTSSQNNNDDTKKKEMLQWISNLHEIARTVGEGVTNVGILLYPPLDVAKASEEEIQKWQDTKQKVTTSGSNCTIPSFGSTTLGMQLEYQLYALAECVAVVNDAKLSVSGDSIKDCLSKEATEGVERLTKAIAVRCNEVEEAIASWRTV